MGESFEFNCPKCGYSTFVSGGVAIGFKRVLSTISCKDCQELFDAIAEEKPWDIRNDIKAEELTGLACDEGKGHTIIPWANPGPCPKCGTTMESGHISELWD